MRWLLVLAQLLLESSSEEYQTMFDNIFGIHEKALLVHGERLGVLTNNLANADTPGYKARDIDFREALQDAGAGAEGAEPLALTATSPSHLTAMASVATATLKYRNPYQASLDGNTVEMPVEQAAFAENNVRYQASLTFINNRIADLQYVLSGQ
jgi:flagellar basal-body rod protein FlgB